MGRLTIKEYEFFKVEEAGQRTYDALDKVQMSIRYEMSLDKIRIERSIYGVLDWLGDCGGFNEGMSAVGLMVLAFLKFEPLQNYYVKRMFLYDEDGESDDKDSKGKPENECDK